MKNILIVDDVKGWIDFHTGILNEILGNNINIITANSANEAYDILLTEPNLDIIITDLQMEEDYTPKMAGEWFVEQIRTFRKYNKTKIIIVSGAYNVRVIADNLGTLCIPKSTALKCISAYEEVLNN